MKRSIIIFLILSCSTNFIFGQKIEHYLSYNFPHTSFFNHTKRNVPILSSFVTPSISYTIQKEKYGLELFGTIGVANYELWDTKENSKEFLNSRMNTPEFLRYLLSGLTFHYFILNKKWIKVSPIVGIAFGWYDADEIGYSNDN